MTFPEASLIAGDLSRTVSGWVIKPGDTSWDEARRRFNLRMDQHPAVVVDTAAPAGTRPIGAGTLSRAIAGRAMLWRSIGTFTLDGKHVAALSHYQTNGPSDAARGVFGQPPR